ncbi:MAG TPA: phytanoyl-CoA dioxygenase family protein, partial [Vicinamibacteria bacterium]
MAPTEAGKRQLDEQGFVQLEGFLSAERRTSLKERLLALFEEEGERAGSEFKQEPGARRLANLVDKGELFRECILAPEMLAYVGHVLGGRFKLSSLNARSANPRNDEAQPLHVDMGLVPDERGYSVCNTVFMLDDFTTENGALRAVPGSHRWGRRPQDVLPHPEAPHPG